MDNIKFGKFIKELRQEQNMTQKELAEKINLTDKAISKWERGLSFPDITMLNTLADVFKVSVAEILNGERGSEEHIDVEKAVKEAIEAVTLSKEKREKRLEKWKQVTKITSAMVFVLSCILQSAYIFILKRYEFEYVMDSLFYVVNEIILVTGMLFLIFGVKKIPVKRMYWYGLCVILTMINVAFMINNGLENRCIVDFSSDFSNQLVLKQNKKTGATTIYKNAKILFARPKEQFSYEVEGKIKRQWLEKDICALTYTDKNGNIREYVATYGDRSNGKSYYYVTTAIRGEWQVNTQNGVPTKVKANSKGITVVKNRESDQFSYEECKQFGTIAIVLYHNDVPKYAIGLDKTCKIDEQTGLIQKDGTLTLVEVSMDKTILENLYCITYKNSQDMSNYKIVDLPKGGHEIRDGILYVSYDGEKIMEVPGNFSEMKSSYNKQNYQISEEKIAFFYNTKEERYLVYSDDMGETWETVLINRHTQIQSLQFVNSNVGYMLEIEDVAMGGTAWGKISKTIDGGKTWQVVSTGIEHYGDFTFKTATEMLFVTEDMGFVTMPQVMGEYCDLYITKDGAKTFSQVILPEHDIYDNYKLPVIKGRYVYLTINKGTDGDYSVGEQYREYYLKDANTWVRTEEKISDTTIQGLVEVHHDGHIYLFNGEHFGELGYEIDGYTSAYLEDCNQVCIDYKTGEKYDATYIEIGDLLICTGDLTKKVYDSDFDTKNNPIIVLKQKDYRSMKQQALSGDATIISSIKTGWSEEEYLYIEYDIMDKNYHFPFIQKVKMSETTEVIGKLEKGKEIKRIEYKQGIDGLELKLIEV